MRDSDVNLPLSFGDSPVMELMDELDNNAASLQPAQKMAAVFGRTVACQTDFDSYGESSIPLIFCGLFASVCEASTQCDIPAKVNVGVSTDKPELMTKSTNTVTVEKDPIKITVPMGKDSGVRLSKSKEGNSIPKEDFLFRPKGILPSVIVPPAPDKKVEDNDVSVSIKISQVDVSDLPFKVDPDKQSASTNGSRPPLKRGQAKSFEEDAIHNEMFVKRGNNSLANTASSEKRLKRSVVYDSNIDEDPQLKAVEECLLKMKKEPELENEVIAPVKAPKKDRINILKNILQQDINLEVDDEWITDDEVDDDSDDNCGPMEQGMKDEGQRTCKECNLTFNSHLLLIEHTESNHVANVCEYCGFTTTFKNKLERHLVKHTKEKAFICDMCGKQYSQKQNLRDHISRYHCEEDNSGRYPYSCEHCKRMYRNENNLIKHLEIPGGKCDICGEEVPCTGILFRHKKNHATCSCEYCGKVFQSKSALQIHVNIKHKDKGLQCSMCPKKFLFPSYLKLHFANAHSQNSPQFKCKECGFCAVTESYLKSHLSRMHRGGDKRKYVCQVCQKNFRSNARLVEHTRIHTGERPFACPVCFKTFYSQSNLYSHERTVHGRLNNYGSKVTEDPEDAPVMKKVFSSCYECESCSSTFNNRKKLKVHMENEHNMWLDGDKTTFEEMVSEMTDIEVAPMQFEMDDETVVQSEDYITDSKKEVSLPTSGDESSTSRSALSLPAYVVPPNVNLVEIDGVQYHVIRSNT